MKFFTKMAVIAGGFALVLASVTPAQADGPPPPDPKPSVKRVVKTPKPKPAPVTHKYVPAPAAPIPVYNPPPAPVRLQAEPKPSADTEVWVYGVIKTKHAWYRQAFIDHDDCVYGGGVKIVHGGFFVGGEGLTECSDGIDVIKTKKKKKHGYGYYYKYTEVDNELDRGALYGGWKGYLFDQVVLDASARHEFASDDQNVTRATVLVGYEFRLAKNSTVMPYTGIEMLLTDRDDVCIENTMWTVPVGLNVKLAMGENFKLFGDGSVNFSDDERHVAVVEIGAEIDFDIGGVPVVLVPSAAYINRFDDGEDSPKYGSKGYDYGYHGCYGASCQQDDTFYVAQAELRVKVDDIFN